MLCTVMSAMTITAFAKEQVNENQSGSDSDITFSAEISDGTKGGSVLSEGSLAIIVGVTAAVVFGLGGFFIGKAVGKKKQPALANGTENTDEE